MSWIASLPPQIFPDRPEALFAIPSGLVEVILFELDGTPRAPRVTTCSTLKIAREFASLFSADGFAVVFHDNTEVGWYRDAQHMPGSFPAEELKVKRTWALGFNFPALEKPTVRQSFRDSRSSSLQAA